MELTRFDEEVLSRVMRTTQAWELLHNPEHCGRLKMVELYDLMVRAGYPDDAAQEAAKQRGIDRLDAGREM